LQDAHQRVLSIAAVQRHLAQSSSGEVALRPYFLQLCESLGASMIRDPKRLTIVATVDDSVVTANASVSLGLIVTELVINALKHAFPDHRAGTITVNFRSQGKNWILSVADNGIGMPKGAVKALPGLGTGIVDALARQLHGRISLSDALPGTAFTLEYAEGDKDGLQTISAV
jgi:two-component sensor histidine kinase